MIAARPDSLRALRAAESMVKYQPQFMAVVRRPTILIADHRDEVFARLWSDLNEIGYDVVRATRSDEVPGIYSLSRATLALCHFDLPDGSGWLTASRLRACQPMSRVWMYAPFPSLLGQCWADLSGLEDVIYYHGDLFRLSDSLRQRFADPTKLRHGRLARFDYRSQRHVARNRLCDARLFP